MACSYHVYITASAACIQPEASLEYTLAMQTCDISTVGSGMTAGMTDVAYVHRPVSVCDV
jgi:hypothetical protein